MPAVIPIIVAVSAGSTVAAAKMSSNAAKDAAKANASALDKSTVTQTDAAKYAAELEDKRAKEALAFTKQQAETDFRNQELARKANYDQWLARESRVSDFGTRVGLPSRSIPAYAAGIDPNYTGGGTLAGAAAGPTMPTATPDGGVATVSAANGAIGPQVANYFAARGVTPNPTSVDYWAQKWNEFGAKDPTYFNTRLAQADEFGGGAAAPAPAGNRYSTMAQAAGLPYLSAPVTPSLQMPGTLAGLVR